MDIHRRASKPKPEEERGFIDLLGIDKRDKEGLTWVKNRAQFWRTIEMRIQRRFSGGIAYSQEEIAITEKLESMGKLAGQILDLLHPNVHPNNRRPERD